MEDAEGAALGGLPADGGVEGGAIDGGVLIGGTETVGTGVRPVGDGCAGGVGSLLGDCVGGAEGVGGSVGVVVGDDVGVVTGPTAAGAASMGAWLADGCDVAAVEAEWEAEGDDGRVVGVLVVGAVVGVCVGEDDGCADTLGVGRACVGEDEGRGLGEVEGDVDATGLCGVVVGGGCVVDEAGGAPGGVAGAGDSSVIRPGPLASAGSTRIQPGRMSEALVSVEPSGCTRSLLRSKISW